MNDMNKRELRMLDDLKRIANFSIDHESSGSPIEQAAAAMKTATIALNQMRSIAMAAVFAETNDPDYMLRNDEV